jgi:hypothetical protein
MIANGWLTNISDGGTNIPHCGMSYEYDSAGRRTRRTLQNSIPKCGAAQLTNIWHRQISGGSTKERSFCLLS